MKKQKIDFILEEDDYPGEETRLLFRFYPRKSRCYGKYSKPPKSWDEVYEVDYVWSIFSQYKDEDEGTKLDDERNVF